MKKFLVIILLALLFVSCNLFGQSATVRGIWNANPASDSVDYYQAEWFQSDVFDTLALTNPTIETTVDTFTTVRYVVTSNYVFLRVRAHNRNGFGFYSDWAWAERGTYAVPAKTNASLIILWED